MINALIGEVDFVAAGGTASPDGFARQHVRCFPVLEELGGFGVLEARRWRRSSGPTLEARRNARAPRGGLGPFPILISNL
jgi:hypothetical protein